MRLMKPCSVCDKMYLPTGNCSKYCSTACKASVWTKERKAKLCYDWSAQKGLIKQPGVGTGHGQGKGSTHHSYKPDAPHRYRDFIKNACERCGSTKYLCGHHKDHDRSNNNKSNIETLCKSCHQQEHKCHENFMSGFDEKRRALFSSNMTQLNKTLPRSNGRNSKVS